MYSCDEVMHFVFYCIFPIFIFYILFLTLLIKEILRIFNLGSIQYQDSKQQVGAGINALMSIADGLGPSIFCRKMEKARPLMEEMDGKVVYFPPVSAFLTLM